MKLVIPPQCQIGAHTFKIVWNTRYVEHGERRAEADAKEQMIRLAHDRSNTSLFESLLHEIRHMIDYTFHLDESEEQITARTAALTQTVLSLGIEPDFSEIPEEKE